MAETEDFGFNFEAGGIADVQKAFATIEQSVLRLEKIASTSASRETRARIAEAVKTSRKRDAVEQALTKDLEKAERDRLAAHVRAEREKIKATVSGTNERARALKNLVSETKATEQAITRVVKNEVAARVRADIDGQEKVRQRRKDFAKTAGGFVGGSVSTTLGTIASVGGQALALGGGLSLGGAIQKGMSAETASVSLANSMFNPNDKEQQEWLAKNGKGGRFDANALLNVAKTAQASSGIDKSDLLAGFQSYMAKSGDWSFMTTDAGKGTLKQLAELAKATDTDFGNVMNTAGSLKAQNAGLSPEEMMRTMYSIVGQGKTGSIEMSDVAKYGSTITAGAGKYQGDQSAAQQRLLGLVQISGRAASSGADASTAVARFGQDVSKKAEANEAAFKKEGFKVSDAKGQLMKPSEILEQYFRVTEGNTTKMGEGAGNLGLGQESIKVAMGEAGIYQAATTRAKLKGDVDKDIRARLGLGDRTKFTDKEIAAIGGAAVRKDVEKLENATYDKGTIDRDLVEKQKTQAERFTRVVAQLSDTAEARALPFVERLATALEKNAPNVDRFINGMSRIAEYVVENPLRGLGALVAGKVATDLASAGIGKAASAGIEAVLAKTGLAPIAIAAAAVAITTAGIAMIDAESDRSNKAKEVDLNDSTQTFAFAKHLERKAREGTATPEDLRQLKSYQEQMGAKVAYQQEHRKEADDWIEGIVGFLDNSDDPASAQYQKQRDDRLFQSQQAKDALDKAVLDVATSLQRIKDAAPVSVDPNAPGRNQSMSTPARGGTGTGT